MLLMMMTLPEVCDVWSKVLVNRREVDLSSRQSRHFPQPAQSIKWHWSVPCEDCGDWSQFFASSFSVKKYFLSSPRRKYILSHDENTFCLRTEIFPTTLFVSRYIGAFTPACLDERPSFSPPSFLNLRGAAERHQWNKRQTPHHHHDDHYQVSPVIRHHHHHRRA